MLKIKKEITHNQLRIVLYDYKVYDLTQPESNIDAFDLNNNFLWKAEICPTGSYYDMQIDEENNTIEANDGSVMFYDIELSNGKIINQSFRK